MALKAAISLVFLGVASARVNTFVEDPNEDGNSEWNWKKHHLLPSFQKPINYDLTLHPVINASMNLFAYSGEEFILMEIDQITNYLVIHLHEIEIEELELTLQSDENFRVNPVGLEYNDVMQFMVLRFPVFLQPASDYVLHIIFHAQLRRDLFGFYRSSYVNDAGERVWMGATQFSSIRARKAFPCFDQPALKATLDFTLIGAFKTMLANMPAISENVYVPKKADRYVADGQEREVHFERTPPMSTYLMGWVVCDFDSTPTVIADGNVEVTAWTQPGQTDLALHSRDNAVLILEHFSERFRIPYPLPKLDLICIPDFFFGAMENWGLITFTERSLKFNPEVDPTSRLDGMTSTLGHEVAHKWFGNLMTHEWWDDVWLKEGFSTFMATYGVDAAIPEWNVSPSFLTTVQRAMDADSVITSLPVKTPYYTADDLVTVFTTMAYQKGASIVRMLSNRINELEDEVDSPFWEAMHEYLDEYSYSNVNSNDLFRVLGEHSDVDVNALLESWILQPGFPVLEFVEDPVLPNTYAIRQRRFLSRERTAKYEPLDSFPTRIYNSSFDGPQIRVDVVKIEDFNGEPLYDLASPDISNGDELYYVPLNYRFQNSSVFFMELTTEMSGPIQWSSSDGWLKIDSGYTGYFRVNYHPQMWDALTDALFNIDVTDSSAQMSVEDRAGLLHDLFAFAQAPRDSPLFGPESVIQALDTTRYLAVGQESAYIPYYFAIRGLNALSGNLIDRGHPDLFEDYVRSLLENIVDKIGWEVDMSPSGHEDALLRELLLPMAARYHLPEAIHQASQLLREHIVDETPLHPDVTTAVWNGGGASDGMFQLLLGLHLSGSSNANRALTALTFNRNPGLRDRLLDLFVDGTVAPTTGLLRDLSRNDLGSHQITDHIIDNWRFYCIRWCDTNQINNLFDAVIGRFNTPTERNRAVDFFEDPTTFLGNTGRARQAYEGTLEEIDRNIEWNLEIGQQTFAWLRDMHR